jgi:hypothetical protein
MNDLRLRLEELCNSWEERAQRLIDTSKETLDQDLVMRYQKIAAINRNLAESIKEQLRVDEH